MPLFRYILGAGSVLLALMFLADAYLPGTATPDMRGTINKSTIRITSDRKGPERVVIDTSLPTIVPTAAAANTMAATEPRPSFTVREAFARMVPDTGSLATIDLRGRSRVPDKSLTTTRKHVRSIKRQRSVAARQKPALQSRRQIADAFASTWFR